jgi:hypothetical protein
MNKYNINLLVYSPTLESGIKYWFKFILFFIRYILLYIYIVCVCACMKNKIYLLFIYYSLIYSLTPESGIKTLI